MSDPQRAQRLWLAMAVAMLWMVRVGSEEEAREEQAKHVRRHQAGRPKRRVGRPAKQSQRPRGREQSCIVRGMQTLQTAIEGADAFPLGHGVSENWPSQLYAARHPASSWGKQAQAQRGTPPTAKARQASRCACATKGTAAGEAGPTAGGTGSQTASPTPTAGGSRTGAGSSTAGAGSQAASPTPTTSGTRARAGGQSLPARLSPTRTRPSPAATKALA